MRCSRVVGYGFQLGSQTSWFWILVGPTLLVLLLCASLLNCSGPISLPRKIITKTMEVPPGVILRSECVKVLFSSLCRNLGITLLLVTCFLNEGNHFPGFWSLSLHWTVCCYLSSPLIYYLHVASLGWTNSSCIVFHISRDFQSFGKCAGTGSLFAIRGTTEGKEFLLSGSHSH